MSPKYAHFFGDPLAFGLGHIFLSPWHYLTVSLLYQITPGTLLYTRVLYSLIGLDVVFLTYLLGRRFNNA